MIRNRLKSGIEILKLAGFTIQPSVPGADGQQTDFLRAVALNGL